MSDCNACWKVIGYPGPDPEVLLTPISEGTFHNFQFIPVPVDGLVLDADIVIVGSGAGGGVAAGILSQCKGKRVIVIEKGTYIHPNNFKLLEKDAFETLYEGGGLVATSDMGVALLAGSTWGGGTAVNWACSLRTPHYVRDEWAKTYGLDQFLSREYEDAVDRVCQRINVHKDNITYNHPNRLLSKGLERMGGTCDTAPQNTTGAHNCGWCGLGCKSGGKVSLR